MVKPTPWINKTQFHKGVKLGLVYVLTRPALRETGLEVTLLSLEPLGRPSRPLSSVPTGERFVMSTESSLEKKSSSAS